MAKELTPEERAELAQEAANLKCDLDSSSAKATGDYNMIRMFDVIVMSNKFWELFGDLDFPSTREEITQKAEARQAKRDRIKEIERLLEE